jgi:hypothetical protein
MQAPRQTVTVQALRNARFVERIAHGWNPIIQFPFPICIPASAPTGSHCRCVRPTGQASFSLYIFGIGTVNRFRSIDTSVDAAAAQCVTTRIKIEKSEIGLPPVNFELLRTGKGTSGQWTIVRDPTALSGAALEQSSADETEDRYPVAIYGQLSLKNVEFRARFKIMSGSMRNAGIIVRFIDPNNYYVVSASALEGRVDLFRMVGGKPARIAGTEADVIRDHWHLIAVRADGQQFTVSMDNISLFAAPDRTFLVDGRMGLWTEEDNTTRFDSIEITALPWSETR